MSKPDENYIPTKISMRMIGIIKNKIFTGHRYGTARMGDVPQFDFYMREDYLKKGNIDIKKLFDDLYRVAVMGGRFHDALERACVELNLDEEEVHKLLEMYVEKTYDGDYDLLLVSVAYFKTCEEYGITPRH